MDPDDLKQATERLNAGVPIVSVEPSLIQRYWESLDSVDRERRNNPAAQIGGVGICIPEFSSLDAEHRIALMTRSALLMALIERGILGLYMKDESQRSEVFNTAASMSCDANDVGEALVHKLLHDVPPDVALEKRREMLASGYDPDHPKIGDKFIAWMREHAK